MALNSEAVIVAGNGSVNVAPIGTTLPADLATALPAAWLNLGYVSPEGVTKTVGRTKQSINAWQSLPAIKKTLTEEVTRLSFALMQWDRNTFPLAMGGGAITTTGTGPTAVHKYLPPNPEEQDERAFVLEFLADDYKFRWIAPRISVEGEVETNLTRTGSANLPLTLEVLGTDGVKPYQLLTNHPAFAAA